MPTKRSDDQNDPGDTIDLEQEPIMETAEFKALVELDDRDEKSADANDDALTTTDKLENLTIAVDDDDA